MSRVGKSPIRLLQGVKVDVKDGLVKMEGPKGKLSYRIPYGVNVTKQGEEIHVKIAEEKTEEKVTRSLWGTTRSNLYNMVVGVHTGFKKELDIVGVGYRAAVKGQTLSLTIGFSHPVDYDVPLGISAKVDKNTHITVEGADKVLVGRVAAKIRSFKEPEPYQGKGIRYTDEHIIRKVGKAATAK